VSLKTLTPLHIGAGRGGGKPFEDQVLGGWPIPSEYSPPTSRSGTPQVIKVRLSRRWVGQPYIPASSLRGWLRTLYTGALEASGASNPEEEADRLFGSTEMAGAIALNDLWAEGPVRTFQSQLVRYLPATTAAGGRRGRSRQSFSAELVDSNACFTGEALYVDDALRIIVTTIFAQSATLTGWLRTGQGGENPEMAIPGSPIGDPLFSRSDERWTITWKLGRYAKAYAKALSGQRQIGRPHAYYLVQGTNQVPGWVQVTLDLTPQDEFRLNDWAEGGK
jgi:CRISPR/Cas system CSM-associated protein Csm3 (group 7 of RAMP superfamily)